MDHTLRVLHIGEVTHNVRCIRIEKPAGFIFTPGQATEIAINKPGWQNEKRPFTFTSLNEDPYLEFTIKCYTDHEGVTNELRNLKPGDSLIIGDAWGAIEYKGAGYFIAGGAGITPFIAILRQLRERHAIADNKLFFANRTSADIIYEDELKGMLGEQMINVLSEDAGGGNATKGFIDAAFLKEHINDFNAHFYVCGPDKMVEGINKILLEGGATAEQVVFEK